MPAATKRKTSGLSSSRSASYGYTQPDKSASDSDATSVEHFGLSEIFWVAVISSCLLLFVVVDFNYHTFPSVAHHNSTTDHSHSSGENGAAQSHSSGDASASNDFTESNAREFLEELCGFGTRHMGSHANEVVAMEMIVDRVKAIQDRSKKIHKIELDVQSPSGCFDLDFIGHFTSCYSDVKNILVRIAPSEKSTSAGLLVNCHYDTAISSPGASDDLVSCAIMLETLRVLSQSDVTLKHAIVFNFNGGEEVILQAAHGFITQHAWAKELKAFVNLEAAGSGGREMVFQTGPNNPWLVSAYAESAKHPFASVIGQEIFQSGVIPSDTDFRIYRDFGNIPGIDIAYTYNGYIYHTKYDEPKYIPPGCIQRGGENLLGIVTTLGNSEKLDKPGDSALGKMIFFDILGYFMVCYPQRLGEIINSLVVVAVVLNLYRKLKQFKQSGGDSMLYIKLIGASYIMHAAGFLVIILVDVAIALVLNIVRPMMWYTTNWLTVPVYILPGIAAWILVHQHGKRFYSHVFQLISTWQLESVYFEASLLFWTLLLALLTVCGIGSAYFCMLLVIFPLVIRQLTLDVLNIKMYHSPRLYIALTAASLLVPFLHIIQFAHLLNIFFMPLMGRVGSESMPDIIVGLISLFPVMVISTYLAGFLHVSKDLTALAVKFIVIAVVFSLIGCFTTLGFPYSGNLTSPSAQRHVLHHFSREFYAYNGNLESADHGLYYLPFDKNGVRFLQDIPEMSSLRVQPPDPDLAYGGFPYYFPLINLLRKVYVTEMAKPKLQGSMTVKHLQDVISSDVIRYHFNATGAQVHLNIYMASCEGSEVVAWSFTEGTPIPSRTPLFDRSHYFVYTTSTLSTSDDVRQFWVDIKVPEGAVAKKHWLDISFAVHHLDGPDSMTPELRDLMARFPDWTVPLGWVTTVQHYRV